MPLPELAGWGDRRGFAPSLQPFQSAHVICGRGELVTSTVLCKIESEPSHAAVPATEQQSLEERSSLFECLGIKTSWLHCSGKIAMGILLVVLNFSTLYLLLLFLCFLQTRLTRLALHITKAFEVWLLICDLSAKQRWSCPPPNKAFKSNKAISSSGQGLFLVMQILIYVVWALNWVPVSHIVRTVKLLEHFFFFFSIVKDIGQQWLSYIPFYLLEKLLPLP